MNTKARADSRGPFACRTLIERLRASGRAPDYFAPYLTGSERCSLDKAAQHRDVPKSPIIATGSTGAIGGRFSFIIHILSVQARIAGRRLEGFMKLPRRRFLQFAGAAAAALPQFASALDYPSRPVRIVVGFSAGGTQDPLARLMGQWLSERLGQPFIIENRPGAGGNIATEAVVRATPDGYTLLLIGPPNVINAILYDKLNFSFIRDIAPIANIINQPLVMVVNPLIPPKTVPEFIAYAKANPSKINMASSGNGTSPHLAGEMFKKMADINMVHVPYRGVAPAVTDLLGGQVQVIFATGSSVIEYIRTGKLRALAVTTATRSDTLPNIPTISEYLPGYEASSWNGIGAPRNTPAEIIDRLNKEINAGLADPKIKARLATLGGTVLPLSPAEFRKLISDETDKWAKVIKFAGIKPE
jgi:tripartite-type tricarboxylate transporter receptor subunit TctC